MTTSWQAILGGTNSCIGVDLANNNNVTTTVVCPTTGVPTTLPTTFSTTSSTTPSLVTKPTPTASAKAIERTGAGSGQPGNTYRPSVPPVSSVSTSAGKTEAPSGASSTSKVTTSNDGLAAGAVAGMAIGMFFVGALLAGLVFILLLRRSKRKRSQLIAHQPRHHSYSQGHDPREKGPSIVANTIPGNADDLIPQPIADEAIAGDVSKIRDNMKNHVRTYYHSAPVAPTAINAPGLQNLAIATGVSVSTLTAGLASPSTRQDTLRLALSWVVLSKCTGERHPSLLPAELSGLAASISKADGDEISQARLHSRWKTVTGVLLQQRFGNPARKSERAEIFASTVAELDQIFAPFVQGSVDGGQRRKNLDMILKRAANFAFLLFSQPGSFRFDFASGHGGLVAFPALVQIVGDQGQVLRPARVLLDKEVAV